ncbi:sodium/proton antiporter (CPA1 family) [Kushneria sinocarnis]|uniref:Sodium/proton antiporter (CPA1 family) n=1 Tax=Kushneria sinocarnis TaxID=595502 RepID=A0A420WZB3_9GAMM|nr:cation:proton antiporter [Kushneria sinocarnis]RKR06688.1 sodium/proton antiporter (CPA1 family) [Kushneria sinocarnis]
MEPHITILGGLGLLILLVAWMPILLRNVPLSLPILCILIGFGVFSWLGIPDLDPHAFPRITQILTELTVIISLAGAGLRIDRRLIPGEWTNTARLLGLTMPLTIAAIALLAVIMLGMPWATALLLGAVIAPTDPVLAADVQVGPPRSGPRDEVRFSLTSEAGLNDGLAFPFVYLAIALAAHQGELGSWLWSWVGVDVLWRVAAGVGAGWLIGRVLGAMMFHRSRIALARKGPGFAALGVTFVAYTGAEIIHGYGFIAVFVAAMMLRIQEDEHDFHIRLHDFSVEIEHLLMMTLLLLFGGFLAGDLLDGLSWPMAIVGLLILFLIRPLAGWLGLLGSSMPTSDRGIVSLFGIRGIGSFYYLAYAVSHGQFERIDEVWTLVGFVVLVSVLFHGVSSGHLLGWRDRLRRRMAARHR